MPDRSGPRCSNRCAHQARRGALPTLSRWARARKLRHFIDPIPKHAAVLEIGAGDGWVGTYMRANGWTRYTAIDLIPPADTVGDVRDWQRLGMNPASFDYIIAFEVLEHGDYWNAVFELLKPGGMLLATTPAPHWDWACRILESLGLSQRRTSPHSHLVDLRRVPRLELVHYQRVAVIAQWATLRRPVE